MIQGAPLGPHSISQVEPRSRATNTPRYSRSKCGKQLAYGNRSGLFCARCNYEKREVLMQTCVALERIDDDDFWSGALRHEGPLVLRVSPLALQSKTETEPWTTSMICGSPCCFNGCQARQPLPSPIGAFGSIAAGTHLMWSPPASPTPPPTPPSD
ncbi:hypothetical protein EYF80_029822 [Liparis tanakae]|uniref:Uncharacterized protein n=1 Tax=Liparis tanakae TaxID=230148 RepID=A0A4Z2H3C8_9TELE|nr:hypothetical protein EYF80_029822 [Liparis tanakae]